MTLSEDEGMFDERIAQLQSTPAEEGDNKE